MTLYKYDTTVLFLLLEIETAVSVIRLLNSYSFITDNSAYIKDEELDVECYEEYLNFKKERQKIITTHVFMIEECTLKIVETIKGFYHKNKIASFMEEIKKDLFRGNYHVCVAALRRLIKEEMSNKRTQDEGAAKKYFIEECGIKKEWIVL